MTPSPFAASLLMGALCLASCSDSGIEIQSYILRDRVVVTDRVLLKKALYVAFSLPALTADEGQVQVRGQVTHKGKVLSEAETSLRRGRTGNLAFDMPYEMAEGPYTIRMESFGGNGSQLGAAALTLDRTQLNSSFGSKRDVATAAETETPQPLEPEAKDLERAGASHGYVIFDRSTLEYVFPGARPRPKDVVKSIRLRTVRNKFEPISLCVFPLRDLGKVRVTASDLKGTGGRIRHSRIKIGYVEPVEETTGFPGGTFQRVPALIKIGNEVVVRRGDSRRFWFTLRIDGDVVPGVYRGSITISPQRGARKSVPLLVTVEPITLEDVPGVDYFMLMTYEFTELTMPWSRTDKEKIYRAASKVLRDYRDHGMTTLCPHSPFVAVTDKAGNPRLDDIYATLHAARENGFTRPVFWYMGHLVQTSKPKHPGNVLGFDEDTHLRRMKHLVETVSAYAQTRGLPEVVFLPVDEADDAYQDVQGRRQAATPVLLNAIREAGGKSMLTARSYETFGRPDYLCTGAINPDIQRRARQDGTAYMAYNNDVTTVCRNPAYARYIYGLHTWKNGLAGMSSWTFQNTQNASGMPGRVDAPGNDLYLAYPDPEGPLATLKWEAIREGIDDHKLIHQLWKRIERLGSEGRDTSKLYGLLAELRERVKMPACQPEDGLIEGSGIFDDLRQELMTAIVDGERRFRHAPKQ